MIHVTRVAKPSILQRKEAEWTVELCKDRVDYYQQLAQHEADQSIGKPKTVRAKNIHYAHDEVKTALNNMFHGKCAYCEARIEHITWKQVEHFRPQSIYPKLAYAWNNLLIACPRCNNTKLDQFPLIDETQPTANHTNPCDLDGSDIPLLINPCEDNPLHHFSFEDQYITHDPNDLSAEKSCEVYGLKREGLNDAREEILGYLEPLAKVYQRMIQVGMNEAEQVGEKLKQYVHPKTQFSAMNYAKIVAMGIDPTRL